MAHANYAKIDYHKDFFSMLGLTKDAGGNPAPPAGSYECGVSMDHSTTTTTETVAQASNEVFQNHCTGQPQFFANGGFVAELDDKENCGTVTNGFWHGDGNGVGFRHGTKRFRIDAYNTESDAFYNGEEHSSHLVEIGGPTKKVCSEENGYHYLVPYNGQPSSSTEDAVIDMTSESSGATSSHSISSLCSQCGKKKHKKFCTGYIEEMLYCSQSGGGSDPLMPCAQCLSGQSGHLEHISAAGMDMS